MYRQFIQVLKSPSNWHYYQKASLLYLNFLITPLNRLKAVFFAACSKIEEDAKDFIADLPDKPLEFIGNQAFIEKGFESDSKKSKRDKGIIKSSNKNSEISKFASDEKQLPGPTSHYQD